MDKNIKKHQRFRLMGALVEVGRSAVLLFRHLKIYLCSQDKGCGFIYRIVALGIIHNLNTGSSR